MKFSIITIDPPWRYGNWTKSKNGAAKSQYSCLSVEDLCNLSINDIADENCALFMWITHPKMVEGVHNKLFDAWGFRPVSTAFTWVKTNKDGSEYCGIGFYTRGNSELCLLGLKGKMKVIHKDVRQVIISPRTRHSAKPNHEVRKRIERLFGSNHNKIDIFSRIKEKKEKSGWVNVGNEVDGQDIRDSLNQIIDDTYL